MKKAILVIALALGSVFAATEKAAMTPEQTQEMRAKWQTMTEAEKKQAMEQFRAKHEAAKQARKEVFQSLSAEEKAAALELRKEKRAQRQEHMKNKLENMSPEQKEAAKLRKEQRKAAKAEYEKLSEAEKAALKAKVQEKLKAAETAPQK